MRYLTRFIFVTALLGPGLGCPGAPGDMADGSPDEATGACPMVAPAARRAIADVEGGPTCPDWGCGTNSPSVGDGVVFDELDSSGMEASSHGVKITGAKKGPDDNADRVQLKVDRHFLSAVGVGTNNHGITYVGPDLIGVTFTLLSTDASTGISRSYLLEIEDVKYEDCVSPPKATTTRSTTQSCITDPVLHFWAGDLKEGIPYYRILVFQENTNRPVPICKVTSDPAWGTVADYAIAFAGDRYDAKAKTVMNAEPNTPWFNLACAGATPAKMHLMRHTNAGGWTDDHHLVDGHSPYYTKLEQRQAMLKMFTADYCGNGGMDLDGNGFTVDGQPLSYGDSLHLYPGTPTPEMLTSPTAIRSIEALWNEHGAVCLDTPRRVPRESVDMTCPGIPRCGGPNGVSHWDEVGSWDAAAGVHVISANRPECTTPP